MSDAGPASQQAAVAIGNRCEQCLGPAAKMSLSQLKRELPDISFFDSFGTCGKCGVTRDVHDVAFLVLMRWHGLLMPVDSKGFPLASLRQSYPDAGVPLTISALRRKAAAMRLTRRREARPQPYPAGWWGRLRRGPFAAILS